MAIMDGKYILKDDMDMMGRGNFEILREAEKDVFEVAIPDAGRNREFAISLVDILNAQGSIK